MHKKCPFSVPSVPGVDGKRRREEEERERRKREMSIEEPSYSPIKKDKSDNYLSDNYLSGSSKHHHQGLKDNNPSNADAQVFDEKFCFQLKAPTPNDSAIYWEYDLSDQVTGEYARTLIFREQQYFVRSEVGTPIQTIYICFPGIYGLKDATGQFTDRVCALHLTAMSSLIDDSNRKVYDLLYKQLHDTAIDIPMNLSTIYLKVSEDTTYRSGALGAPLVCQFDIRHSGK